MLTEERLARIESAARQGMLLGAPDLLELIRGYRVFRAEHIARQSISDDEAAQVLDEC